MKTNLTISLLILSACAAQRTADPPPQQTAPRRIVLVTAWADCIDRQEHFELKKFLEPEMDRIDGRLHTLAEDAEILRLRNPDSTTLLAALRRDARPLWFVYSGHGTRDDGGSVLCLPDGKLPESEIIDSPPTAQSYATYLFNTCMSAHVLIPRDNTVVISAGPDTADNEHVETVIGRDLQIAMDGVLDCDNNGVVDSNELFTALDRSHIGDHPVQLKLHAQSWVPLPLFTLKGHAKRDFFAGRGVPAVDSPPLFWLIPQELDGLQNWRDSILRIEPPKAGSADSLVTPHVQVARANGSLVVRDVGVGQVIWRRPLLDGSEPRFTDRDLDDFFRGFEPFEKGNLRWYVRPVSAAQRAELKRLGFQPTSCSEKIGQCFKRPRSPGEDR